LSILVGLSISPPTLFFIIACYLFTSLLLFFLSQQPLLFLWQNIESTTPMTMATTTP
jgi:hypothetical protein